MDPTRPCPEQGLFYRKFFDNHIYNPLNCILKNMTEMLQAFEQSVTLNDSHSDNDQVSTAEVSKLKIVEDEFLCGGFWLLLQICTVLGTIWLLDRHVMKMGFLQKCVEVIGSWILIILALPFLVPIGAGILLYRAGLSIKFKIFNGGKLQLMDPFDAVWTFEIPKSPSTCNGLYVIKGHGELGRVREMLRTRVLDKEDSKGNLIYDRFRWSIVNDYGFMCWKKDPSEFDINDHIRYCQGSGKGPDSEWTEEDLFRTMAELHDVSLLQPGKSPWEILLIPKFKIKTPKSGQSENHYALLFRIHHSIGDGISMGHILHQCIADAPFNFSVDPISPLKISKLTIAIGYIISFILLPQITIRNIFFTEENAFHSEKMLTGPKTVNWSRPIGLAAVKKLKNKSNTSVFTVLLSCLTGAMRSLYIKNGQPVPECIHAAPPIAILPYPDRKPRNRFSVVLYPLATGKSDPLQRLAAIFGESKQLASSPDVLTNYFVIYLMGMLPFFALKEFAALAHATLTFSNIPGPTNKVQVFEGDELTEIGAWIPVKNRIGIAMGLFSYNGKLRVTFIADKVCLPNADDVDLLRDCFETELTKLAQLLDVNSLELLQ